MKKNIGLVGVVILAVGLVLIGVWRRRGGGAATPGSQPTVAVIPKETASVYWEGVRKGALKAGEEERVRILWSGPEIETDRERQIQIVQDCVAQKVDGIVLAPNDRRALAPAVEKVGAAGIPCVVIDSAVDTSAYVSYLATDNVKGGAMAAARLGATLGGKGKLLLVLWTPNSASTDARVQGFRDALARDFPGLQLVDAQYPNPATVEKAREVTEDMLTRNADVQGMFACNATTAAGALQALRAPGQKERGIKLVGFDAWDSLVEGLKAGDVDALIIQNPYRMGYEGVKAVLAHRRGEPVPREVDTGVELVTRERLGEPAIQDLLSLR